MRSKTIIALVLLIVTVCYAAAEESLGAVAGSWAFYGGDAGGRRYSSLNQIDKSNVATLKQILEYHTGDVSDGSGDRPKSEFEVTPIVVGGTMFLSIPFNRVIALDPETGKEKWSFGPKIDLHTHYSEGLINRGVTLWSDSNRAENVACNQPSSWPRSTLAFLRWMRQRVSLVPISAKDRSI